MVMGSILVLGGAGYIGSHTVYELIEAGKDVVVVDNLETGFRAAVHPKAKFYEGDIRNRAFIDSVFDKENIERMIRSPKFVAAVEENTILSTPCATMLSNSTSVPQRLLL